MKRLLLLLTVVIFAACGGPSAETPALPNTDVGGEQQPTTVTDNTTEPQVAARVNGEPILLETFERELIRYEAGQQAIGAEVGNEEGYQQQVLDTMIENALVRQRAAEQGVTVPDSEVDEQINTMINETGEEYFNSWLNANYYSREEFREVIRQDLLFRRLVQPVIDEVPASAEHVRARHILVNTRQDAEAALTRLNNGEDFASVASQLSVDVTTRDNGGDLGWFPRGGLLITQVEETAFSLQPGQRSDIIESAWGYHIVETLEYSADRPIEEETRKRIINRQVEQWRASLRDNATIETLIDLPL